MAEPRIPEPLTPLACDLRDFPFMPLEVSRLRRSRAWLLAKRTPELAFYQINLWTASWHDLPAASLEDDDDVLADLAMCDPKRWKRLKTEAMRGWVLCSDGRWYHPVVAEKALDAWKGKLEQRWRSECARIKKHNERHGTKVPRPEFDQWMSSGCPQGQMLPVAGDTSPPSPGQTGPVPGETDSKGEGERKGQGEGQGQGDSRKPSASGAARPARKCPDGFEVTDEMRRWVAESAPQLTDAGMQRETDKFRDHTFKTAISDWPGAWRNWIRRACEGRLPVAGALNKQEALEASNRAVAARYLENSDASH